MRKALQGASSRRKNKHNKSNDEETIMPMAPTLPLTMARPFAMVDRAREDARAVPVPVEAADRPAHLAIEEQRERAQQEFKRIWTLCTLQ